MRVSAITNPLQCPFRQNTVNKVVSRCFNRTYYTIEFVWPIKNMYTYITKKNKYVLGFFILLFLFRTVK